MKLPGDRLLMVLIPVLWLAVLASAAGAIYVKHRSRELFVELERVNRERDRVGSSAARAERVVDACFRGKRRGQQPQHAYAAAEADRGDCTMTVVA